MRCRIYRQGDTVYGQSTWRWVGTLQIRSRVGYVIGRNRRHSRLWAPGKHDAGTESLAVVLLRSVFAGDAGRPREPRGVWASRKSIMFGNTQRQNGHINGNDCLSRTIQLCRTTFGAILGRAALTAVAAGWPKAATDMVSAMRRAEAQ